MEKVSVENGFVDDGPPPARAGSRERGAKQKGDADSAFDFFRALWCT